MKRRTRLALLALLAAGIAPTTWLRTPIPPPDFAAPLRVTPMADPKGLTGDVELRGAWQLDSENAHFGGYSALIALSPTRLLVGSDRGRILEMPLPQSRDNPRVRFDFFADTSGGPRIHVDLESLAYDPAAGTVWGAYEFGGRIQRFDYGAGGSNVSGITLPVMKAWPENGGAETMVRLADGRFIILAEASSSDSRAGLLFAGDPLGNPDPLEFRFVPGEGYSPVDGTLLPDGRVMVLLRRVEWGLPPRFATALMVADPAEITEDGVWQGEIIARIDGGNLDENFEGLAAIEQEDGIDLYVIADDNISAFQDTLMLRLFWQGGTKPAPSAEPKQQKSRENPANPAETARAPA